MLRALLVALFFLGACSTQAIAACPYTSPITTAGTYTISAGNTYTAIKDALACAKIALGGGSGHNVTMVVSLPSGTIDLSHDLAVGKGSISIIGFNCAVPSEINCGNIGGLPVNTSNKLVVQGNNTTIINAMDSANHNNDRVGLWVEDSANITFTGMTFTYPYMAVTQGKVVSSNTTSVTVDLPTGFPTPNKIKDTVNFPDSGRYLHRFEYYKLPGDSTNYCRFIPNPVVNGFDDNPQVPWVSATRPNPSGQPKRWKITFESPEPSAPYAAGQIIGIKSKEGQNVYTIRNVSHFTFDNVTWSRRSRGVFTGDTSDGVGSVNLTVTNNTILPEAPINGTQPCMSTPDGGPQFGGRLGLHASGHYVAGNHIVGTGDDGIAFFDVTDSEVTGNTITDSYSSRGIMFDFTDPNEAITSGNSGITFCPNTVVRNSIFQKIGDPAPSLLIECP